MRFTKCVPIMGIRKSIDWRTCAKRSCCRSDIVNGGTVTRCWIGAEAERNQAGGFIFLLTQRITALNYAFEVDAFSKS